MKYDLDIGKWECRVMTVEADSPQEAIKIANQELDPRWEYVVEARETKSRRLVYDFIQGFYADPSFRP